MTDLHHKQNRRPNDDGGLGLGVSIIAAFAIMLVLGLAFWTLNDNDRVTALNTSPSTTPGITTGIAPPAK
jgi:hypothetical protein